MLDKSKDVYLQYRFMSKWKRWNNEESANENGGWLTKPERKKKCITKENGRSWEREKNIQKT